jgi:trehalose/maltose hydrolase-like predicted phosphorylase
VEAALTLARESGWEGLLAEQREYLDEYWARADVDLDGDEAFEREAGLALLVETARLWASLGCHPPTAVSGSPGSPARTSTAPWPTTTCTRI